MRDCAFEILLNGCPDNNAVLQGDAKDWSSSNIKLSVYIYEQ